MTVHGQFHWNELMTHDAQKAREFYSDCIGWKFDEFPMGDGPPYLVAMVNGEPVGGIFQMQGAEFENVPEHWIGYLHVDNLDEALEEAKTRGAKLQREPFDVPEVGRIAILVDPGGALMGWITPAANQQA